MGDIETVKIKDGDDGFRIINKSDFTEGMELYHEKGEGEATDRSKYQPAGRNTSGTYSEPTPSDIRYPDQDDTEFENNHGAFVDKSAAEMREESDLPDAPGGIHPIPDDWKSLKAAERRAMAKQLTGEDMTTANADEAIEAEVDRRQSEGK